MTLTAEAPVVPPAAPERRSGARFGWWLAGIAVVGLAARVGYVFAYRRHVTPAGDSFYYHYQANLLAAGHVFINPFLYYLDHRTIAPAADHPPAWTLVLALAARLGVTTFFGQILWSCVVGALGLVVIGLCGREMAGPRAGLVAAAAAALYPPFWINDGAMLSETLVALTTALMVWAFYRLWHRPSLGRAAALGAAAALAALTRSELAVLVAVFVVGVGAMRLVAGARRRLALSALTLIGALVVFSPWWILNAPRYDDPVLLSSQLGVTVAGANCAQTYSGPMVGYWSLRCVEAVPVRGHDKSRQDDQLREAALHYAEAHAGQVPGVVAVRLGRELGLFRPLQQIQLEARALGRPTGPATAGLFAYYAVAAAAVAGAVVLRRRRVPLFPLVAVAADVLVVAALTWGQTRYRTSLDVVLLLLAGVAVDALVTWRSARWSGRAGSVPDPGVDQPADAPT